MLHVCGSRVHSNITLCYVHDTLYIVGMCEAGISTTICRNVYVLEISEIGICINSMQAIYYISMIRRGRLETERFWADTDF